MQSSHTYFETTFLLQNLKERPVCKEINNIVTNLRLKCNNSENKLQRLYHRISVHNQNTSNSLIINYIYF